MKRCITTLFCLSACCAALCAQTNASTDASPSQDATLQLNARAVLVDVIVTDNSGRPVAGLPRDAFSILEDGKSQSVQFFEEHAGKLPPQVQSAEMPQLPPNVFSNFSPFPQPEVVNVLLLDSLNSTMDSQGWTHKQALKFLKSAKPGQRMAIFTMDLGLHFIQGFNDDPTVLAAALESGKNNPVQASVMLKSQSETNAEQSLVGIMSQIMPGDVSSAASPQSIVALQNFIDENDTSRATDRIFLSLANLQRLAAFLEGFPGRKNIIWFAEKVPTIFVHGTTSMGSMESSMAPGRAAAEFGAGSGSIGDVQTGNPAVEREVTKTLAMLAAARAALYPVDPRGAQGSSLYNADTTIPLGVNAPGQMVGPGGGSTAGASGGAYFTDTITSENRNRNNDQIAAQIVAEQSGGHAYANVNGLADLITKITNDSSHFYTLSYRPANEKMDGVYRKVDVKVAGGRYRLAYRRGYFAVDEALPGSSVENQRREIEAIAARNPGAVDPLLPFMSLGMPQTEQILYKIRVSPVDASQTPVQTANTAPNQDKINARYKVDFALDTDDLALPASPDGARKGVLNVSLVVYDRYANVVSREDHLVQLNFKPEQYDAVKKAGVQLHAQLALPKGNYWLRTGVYDRASHKVGTMEIPLTAVKPVETAQK